MNSVLSPVIRTSVSSIAFYPENLKLEPEARHVFKTGQHPNNEAYRLVMLIEGDEMAVFTAAEIIRSQDPESLKFRSPQEYGRMLSYGRFNGSGGFITGLVDENDRLIGMSVIEAMDDESDHGSGPVVLHHGVKNNYEQVYYKALGLLPEARGKGHMEELYQVRDALFLKTGRPFAVMKTNTRKVIERAVTKGWVNLSENPQPEWQLQYESEAARKGKIVDVLILKRETLLDSLANNKSDIVLPDLCIIHYDSQRPTIY